MSAEFEAAVMSCVGREPLSRGSAAELARRLAVGIEMASTQPMVFDFGKLWRYDPPAGRWVEITPDETTRLACAFDGWGIAEEGGKDKALKVGGGLWRDTRAALEAMPMERSGFFGQRVNGIALQDRFVEVTPEGLISRRHAPEQRQRHTYPATWDEAAEAPRWAQALGEWGLSPDVQRFTAQAFGLALIGMAPVGGKALFLVGGGRNGKSVFMAVMQSLFPPDWRSGVPLAKLNERFTAAELFGKRLNSVAEIDAQEFLSSAAFKAIVTGDEIHAEAKYKDGFTFRPECLLCYSMNSRPAVSDITDGFWRRVAVIEFLARFDGAAVVENLAEKIIAAERQGLIAWALRGAVDRLRNGWAPGVEEAAADWRAAENPIAAWIADVGGDLGGWDPAFGLFQNFKRWAEPRNRLKGLGDRTFYERLAQHLSQVAGDNAEIKKKVRGAYWYRLRVEGSA